ncbi:Fibroblast growth factor receptor [Acropora cervicornis]|uniref:Fibroblast growth factor receptor n=1 Tax=Acropora cervicornis TaxID=6130 RepID=A0AAD9R5A7_ACRCE|nr:Fibroblast growth factor receptor [Acropora cervicornis]
MGENLTCKVTDFGLARDIREEDLYQKTTGGRLPVKWTAIEALLNGRYTTMSDVWSFGVVLFEIATIGGSPYQNMEVLELIDKLESGYRMEKPDLVPDDVYALMLSCWDEDPNKRPTFVQLKTSLSQMAKKKQGSINLKAINWVYSELNLTLNECIQVQGHAITLTITADDDLNQPIRTQLREAQMRPM